MKKILFLLFLSATTLIVSAQITTYPTGNVNIKRSSEFPMNVLSVGEDYYPSYYTSYQNGVHSRVTNTYNKYNVALFGDVCNSYNLESGRSIGVLGSAGFSTDGYNYGVFGRIYDTQRGAGIFGTSYNSMGCIVNGKYAGFFDGPVYVQGTLKVWDLINMSDIRLKENIVPISETENGSTLDNVLGMNVIEYNFKDPLLLEADKDTLNSEYLQERNIPNDRHYGLSAQELQSIYPNLVKEGQDGYLGVNYIELVPILIRSIQELNEKIETMESRKTVPTSTSDIDMAKNNKSVLYQNTPNPFGSQTVIKFSLSEEARDAFIYVFSVQGDLKKQISLKPSQNSVVINAYDLTPGIYLYSLVVGGQEVATKRMIISK